MLYWFGVVWLCTLEVAQKGRASSFLNRLYWFGVVGVCILGADQKGKASSFLNRFYWLVQQGSAYLGQPSGVGHLWCSRDLQYLGSVSKGAISFLNRVYRFGVVALYTWGELVGAGPPHFLIGQTGFVQQVTVHLDLISRRETLWCSRVMYTWASMQVVHLHWVCEYFSIGSTDFVLYCSVPLGLISRGGPPHFSIGSTGLLQQGSVHLGSIRKGASLFLNRFYWFAVVGLCTLGVEQQGRASSFLNKLYWFGVVGINTLEVAQLGRASVVQQGSVSPGLSQPWGHVIFQQGILVWCSSTLHLGSISRRGARHFLIGYTGLVQQVNVHLGLINRRETLWCQRAMYSSAQGGGPSALDI